MAAESSSTDEISWSRLLPWTRLFRSVGFSIDARKLILAALGLVFLNLGWEGLDRLFPSSRAITPPAWEARTFASPATPDGFVLDVSGIPWKMTEPARYIVGPFLSVFSVDTSSWAFLHAVLASIWVVVVWGFFGGAICRSAVLQATRGERLSVVKAVRFAAAHALTLSVSPLSPFLGIALVATFGALFGLLYRLPTSLGTTLAGVLLFLPLLGGFFIAVIAIPLAVGWPLMHATVAAEAEDGFDALSRSYAYVHQRPGRYAAYTAIAWLIGCVGLLFVEVFTRLVLHLCQWSLSFSAPQDLLGGLFGTNSVAVDPTSSAIHGFWLFVVGLLVHGWIYVYFWTAVGIIYLLLRRDVDGTDGYQVAVDEPATLKRPRSLN